MYGGPCATGGSSATAAEGKIQPEAADTSINCVNKWACERLFPQSIYLHIDQPISRNKHGKACPEVGGNPFGAISSWDVLAYELNFPRLGECVLRICPRKAPLPSGASGKKGYRPVDAINGEMSMASA